MKDFESQQFRDELAKTIKQAPKGERRDILDDAREKRFFGPKPGYLSEGLDVWLEASNSQAEKGIAGLKRNQRFEIFYSGMASYFHQEPKDIGAVSARLKELGKFTEGETLLVKREYGEGGGIITPEFERLFANASDTDLAKAGISFYEGTSLYENLRVIAKKGINPSMIDPSVLLAWRRKDFDVHRKEFDGKELELLLRALDAQAAYQDFMVKNRKQYMDDTMTEEAETEMERLKRSAGSAREGWWSQFCLAVEQEV